MQGDATRAMWLHRRGAATPQMPALQHPNFYHQLSADSASERAAAKCEVIFARALSCARATTAVTAAVTLLWPRERLVEGGEEVRRVKVLIAEDNEKIREYMVQLLCHNFEIVKAVSDGMSLIAAAIELGPDVIVSDISMPRLSGPRAMEELKLQEVDIPFVFVSADVPPIKLGAAFVSKTEMGRDIIPAIYKAVFSQP
jgi:CheY-like chemotaxis protein